MPQKQITDSELINLSVVMTVREIADYKGLPPWTVRRRLKRAGIEQNTMHQATKKLRYSDEELVAFGHFYSLTVLAAITGYSYTKIITRMKKISNYRRHSLDKIKIERMIKEIQSQLHPPKVQASKSVSSERSPGHDSFDPIDCETIVYMRDRHGRSFCEIAEVFGCNEDLVEKTYNVTRVESQE